MKHLLLIFLLLISLEIFSQNTVNQIVIDESSNSETIVQTIKIDSVWAGHPVGFCLYSHGNRQYIAYYNANRNIVVG